MLFFALINRIKVNFDQYHLKQCLVVNPSKLSDCITSADKNLTRVDFRAGLESHAEALRPKIQRVEGVFKYSCYFATLKKKV